MQVSLEDIISNGEQENLEWLEVDKDSYLYLTYTILHGSSKLFAVTSCEVTAAMIQWKYNCNCAKLLENVKLQDVLKNHTIFTIPFGEDWSDTNHILTVINGHIVQSYYKHYSVKSNLITDDLIEAIDNISLPGNYEKVTGVKDDNTYHVYYWIM